MSLSALKGPGEVAAEAIMTRMDFAGTLLIVEGDDDSRFFRGRIDKDACDVIIAGGKALTLAAAAQLKVSAPDLEARLAALPTVDPWLLCQGHDLLAILASGFGKGGALGSRTPGHHVIASTLRASLDTAP